VPEDNADTQESAPDLNAEPEPTSTPDLTQDEIDAQVKRVTMRRTRRSFVIAGAAAAGGYGFYRWIDKSEIVGRQPEPLRKAFEFNAALARGVFHEANLAPAYPKERAVADLRTNGFYGLSNELVLESWRLQLVGVNRPHQYPQFAEDVTAWNYQYLADEHASPRPAAQNPGPAAMTAKTVEVHRRGSGEAGPSHSGLEPNTAGLLLTMDDLRKLPHRDLVTEFKCIEGWSEVASWGGVRLADLIAAYPPALQPNGTPPRYVYMETPDGDYYCGYDMKAAMHPQSLLVYEMGGKAITRWHGAPLRLHMPIKYGYKQIKRIGLIAYTDIKPDDYWTKLGYDWYAGL
jgi:hypothetical protein